MTRRHAITTLCAIPVVAIPTSSAKSPTQLDMANDFAEKYNEWITFKKVAKQGIVDVGEVRAWKEASKAWEKLKKMTEY